VQSVRVFFFWRTLNSGILGHSFPQSLVSSFAHDMRRLTARHNLGNNRALQSTLNTAVKAVRRGGSKSTRRGIGHNLLVPVACLPVANDHGWSHCHCRLGVLFADLNILSSAPASSCTPSAPPFTLNFSACLLIPLGFKIHLWGFQSRNEVIAGWICLQRRPVSCVVCVLLSLLRLLPSLLHMLVPPLALQTPPLPRPYGWSTCFCHFRPPGCPYCVPPATS
jgi:hypothetical protein